MAALSALAVALTFGPLQTSNAQVETDCPNAEFRKGAASYLPGCRAYEQVSPVDKNGGDLFWSTPGANNEGAQTVAGDGSRAVFSSLTEFAGVPSGGTQSSTRYLSRRVATGWVTVPMVSRPEPVAAGADLTLSSRNLTRSLFVTTGVLASDPPDLSDESINTYIRDNLTDIVSPFLAITSVAPNPAFLNPATEPDMEHLVFTSSTELTGEVGVPPSPTLKVYERVAGETRLVALAPDETPVPLATRPGAAGASAGSQHSTVGAVSDDGRHIFFTAFDGSLPTAIYRRTDGESTVLASPSKRTPADPEGPRGKQFRFATPDGGRVFFTSSELLTDDANTGPGPNRPGSDLYRYDVDSDELVDISATPGGNGAQVIGVVGFDELGDRVYYVASGEVVPGGEAGKPNLYLWEDDGSADGVTRYVATLSAADSTNWFRLDGNWTARTTPDGGQLVFQSVASIPGPGPDGVRQVYRYDADANGGTGDLTCVSCNPSAATPIGPSTITDHLSAESVQRWELPRALSDDGQRVFFNSEDALVPRDSNGEIDAYMWENGEVSLLSTGTSSRESRIYGASASGDDVFILTDEALVPQDQDDLIDLYDVRVGGGFPAPPPRSDCDGQDCQGAGAAGPAPGAAGSTGLVGGGDLDPGVRQEFTVKRPSRAQRQRLASGRQIGLRVRVTKAAKIRAVLLRRGNPVARGSSSARKAGVLVVRLRLNRSARRALLREGSMRLSLKVTAQGARPRTLSLQLEAGR